MKPGGFLAAGSTTAVGLALLAYGSAVPLPYHPEASALLRLSWSARPERIETCRAVSAAEQARLEEHMRQRVVCEGRSATYLLRVDVDGQVIGERVLRGGGLRHDRPLYVLRGYPVPAGEHRIRVSMTRREAAAEADSLAPAAGTESDTGLFAGRAQREAVERARRARAAVPAVMVLETVVRLSPRQVAVVTLDGERRVLRLTHGSAR